MDFIALLGFLSIIFSIFYLIFHFIKKAKHKEKVLSKKIFYPALIGGFVFLILGISFMDTGVQGQLNKALEKNEELTNKNTNLKSENKELNKQVTALESEIKKKSSKVTKYENSLKSLKEEKSEFDKDKESLNDKISDLTETKTNLKDKVINLESKLETTKSKLASAQLVSSSSSKSTTGNSNYDSSTTNSSEVNSNVYYDNCTAAKEAGAAPVRRGDPGYASHLDRDGDGVGCES
ncbi:hypothetical protein CFK37_09025 [Virgibacillus phasianinus]|uniref:Excalibur calcium-binding domain-containing protein n=1 Tax=Virgibacillus phasianinus TaxID=2017483 RepID=A0A220U392_9BACI|nr:excalibur calcium-binding domain-containing protein [Virgibacillus phasianinus]ASK62291.1 hypothetical protein CFK37_09025 [Virgibacillus phasianinus]